MSPDNLSIAFAVWSAVVALTGGAVVYELSRLRKDLGIVTDRLNTLMVDYEHRLTIVEADIQRCARKP